MRLHTVSELWEGNTGLAKLEEHHTGPKDPKVHRALLRERIREPEWGEGIGRMVVLHGEEELIVAGRTRGQAVFHLWHGGGEGFGVREGVTGDKARGTRARLEAIAKGGREAEQAFAEAGVQFPSPESGDEEAEEFYEGCEDIDARWERLREADQDAQEDAYGREWRALRDQALEEDYIEFRIAVIEQGTYCGKYGDDWRVIGGGGEVMDREEAMHRALAAIEEMPPVLVAVDGDHVVESAFDDGWDGGEAPWVWAVARRAEDAAKRIGALGPEAKAEPTQWVEMDGGDYEPPEGGGAGYCRECGKEVERELAARDPDEGAAKTWDELVRDSPESVSCARCGKLLEYTLADDAEEELDHMERYPPDANEERARYQLARLAEWVGDRALAAHEGRAPAVETERNAARAFEILRGAAERACA